MVRAGASFCLVLRTDFPDLDPFTTWAYGSPARLLLRMSDNTVEVIMRQRGVQQGCPFSPFFFSLAMRRVNLAVSLALHARVVAGVGGAQGANAGGEPFLDAAQGLALVTS
jgi:hypothetical protein